MGGRGKVEIHGKWGRGVEMGRWKYMTKVTMYGEKMKGGTLN